MRCLRRHAITLMLSLFSPLLRHYYAMPCADTLPPPLLMLITLLPLPLFSLILPPLRRFSWLPLRHYAAMRYYAL